MRFVVAALLLLAALPARADRLAEIKKRGRIVVSIKREGAASPSLHNDALHFRKRGFELELARAISRRLFGDDQRLDTRESRGFERISSLTAGEVDLVIAMVAIVPSADIEFSEPYYVGEPSGQRHERAMRTRFGVAVKKGEAALLAIVNDVISELRRSGELGRAMTCWQLPPSPELR